MEDWLLKTSSVSDAALQSTDKRDLVAVGAIPCWGLDHDLVELDLSADVPHLHHRLPLVRLRSL